MPSGLWASKGNTGTVEPLKHVRRGPTEAHRSCCLTSQRVNSLLRPPDGVGSVPLGVKASGSVLTSTVASYGRGVTRRVNLPHSKLVPAFGHISSTQTSLRKHVPGAIETSRIFRDGLRVNSWSSLRVKPQGSTSEFVDFPIPSNVLLSLR